MTENNSFNTDILRFHRKGSIVCKRISEFQEIFYNNLLPVNIAAFLYDKCVVIPLFSS